MRLMHDPNKSTMRACWWAAVAALVSLLSVSSAIADADAEPEALARLVHEIEALAPLIETAESQANPDARIRVQRNQCCRHLFNALPRIR